jgi:DNA-binding transcriptional ArsR family regulator
MRRDVFQAIADPTRREIINLLATKSLNLNAIADNFEMSRPAISQHIKVLNECGLISIKKEGRERFCEVKFQKLSEVSKWVEQYRVFWTNKLDALDIYLTAIKTKVEPKK